MAGDYASYMNSSQSACFCTGQCKVWPYTCGGAWGGLQGRPASPKEAISFQEQLDRMTRKSVETEILESLKRIEELLVKKRKGGGKGKSKC